MSAKKIRRRGLLKGLGLTIAGTALAACAPTVVEETVAEETAARETVTISHSDLVFLGDAERPRCHCATLTELPNGDLMTAWYAGTREGNPDVAILESRLPQGATSWTPAQVLVPAAHEGQGNPVLFIDGRERVFLVYNTRYGPSWEECKVHYKISEDQGQTWGPQRTLHEEFGWMVRNKPIRLRNGDLLLPIYDEIKWSAMVLISADEGDNWSVHGDITAPTGCIQPTVIQRSDSELFMLLRRGDEGGCVWTTALSDQLAEGKVPDIPLCVIWSATSSDDGRTWTETEPVNLPNPNSAIDMVQLENGHLLLAFNNSHRARSPLSLALSTDEGQSWEVMCNLEEDSGEYSYPAIIQARDKEVHIVYTYRREAIKHVVVTV